MTDEWGEPTEAMGDRVNPRDIVGHLLIVWPIEYISHSPTRFTVPGKASDVIVVDVCDLDLPDEQGYQGRLSRKVWWRQSRIIANLKNNIGIRMLCRMVQGTGTTGFNAPFELISMLSEPACKARADQWLKAHLNFEISKPGRAEMNADLNGHADLAKQQQNAVIDTQKTYLERIAEQSAAGAARVGGLPPPPPSPDTPGF